ncbi:hypothetical protein FOZ62_022970 [Perkinsus olseni]|uniref:Uncharacterized protein n=1 Tax=Perkinsus olseni TaxID=32597 RepID=A0A7J6U303_PEROL|nr:hypothetical protein FOZ62_022970 [Perkinsus olseni]
MWSVRRGVRRDRGRLTLICRRAFSARSVDPWEEVEAHRPRVPTLHGYRRPAAAPQNQTDIPREDFHKFMRGRPRRFPDELAHFLFTWAIIIFMVCLTAGTMYKLRPDDFDWIEQERSKAEAAKARLDKRLEAQKTAARAIQEGQVLGGTSSTDDK